MAIGISLWNQRPAKSRAAGRHRQSSRLTDVAAAAYDLGCRGLIQILLLMSQGAKAHYKMAYPHLRWINKLKLTINEPIHE
jgi:hypothetical protein